MEKLESKHIVGYLPYGLKMYWEDLNEYPQTPWLLKCHNIDLALENQNKPILRPLSDLTKEIEHNGEKFVPMGWFEKNINKNISFYLPSNLDIPLQIDIITENYSQTIDLFEGYLAVQKLYEWHFDIHGLIEKGLAIDKNTLK